MIKLNKNLVLGTILAFVLSAVAVMLPPKMVRAQFNGAQGTYITTVGGTVNAITATLPNISSLNDIKGVPISVVPSGPNTGPATLNFNGLGAVTIVRFPFYLLGGGELGQFFTVVYNGTWFYVTSPQDLTPPGTAIDIRGTVAPTGYLIEDGSCVSQTTYAALFAVISTSYGSCSAGLFALPDSRGTVSAARDNQGSNGAANRITTAGSGCNAVSNILCGSQSQTLTLAQIPTGITAAGTSAGTITGSTSLVYVSGTGSGVGGGGSFGILQNASVSGSYSGGASVVSNNTGGGAHPLLNPVLIGLRAVKY